MFTNIENNFNVYVKKIAAEIETKGLNDVNRQSIFDTKCLPLAKIVPIIEKLEPIGSEDTHEDTAKFVFFGK